GPLNLDGAGNNFVEVAQLTVQGLKFSGITPTPMSVPRSTFSSGRAEVIVDSAANATVKASFDGGASFATLLGDGQGTFYVSSTVNTMPSIAKVIATSPNNGQTTVNAPITDVVTVSAAV